MAASQDPASTAPYRRMAYTPAGDRSRADADDPGRQLPDLLFPAARFVALPERLHSASDVSTGFSDRVQLGRIGQIQQSSAVVMHIEIQNDIAGRLRSEVARRRPQHFDGKVWSNSYAQTAMTPFSGRKLSAGASSGLNARGVTGRIIHYRVLMEPLGTNVFFLAEKPQSLAGNFRREHRCRRSRLQPRPGTPHQPVRSRLATGRT